MRWFARPRSARATMRRKPPARREALTRRNASFESLERRSMLAGIWAAQAGGTNTDSGRSVSALPDGSAIVAGSFAAFATFGSTTLSQAGTSLTNGSGFVAKLNSDGTYAWAAKVGRSATAVAALPDGSSIVTGAFVGSAAFGSTVLTASGGSRDTDIFVTKVSPNGQFAWATQLGTNSSTDIGRGISAFADGSVVITGVYNGSGFVATLTPNGRLGYVTSVSGTPIAVAALSDGSAFVTGATSWLNDLSSPTGTGFVAKVAPNGSTAWRVAAGGTGYSISAGTDGSAFVTGAFEGTRGFGGSSLTSSGKADAFVAKLTGSGQYAWSTRLGSADNVDVGRGISSLPDGSVLVVGSSVFGRTDPGRTTPFWYTVSQLLFSRVNADGAAAWTKTSGGLDFGNDGNVGYGVSAMQDGSAVLVGSLKGALRLGAVTLTSNGSTDVFVARTAPGGTFAVVPSAPTSVGGAATANGQVSLSWAAPANGGAPISRYVVQLSADSGATWTTFRDDVSGTSVRIDRLTNGTPYVFRVSAVNEAGGSPFSQPSGVIIPQPFAPDAPMRVGGSPGDRQVTLTWQAPANDGGAAIVGYSVQYSSDRGATWVTWSGSTASTSAVVSGLTNGAAYIFRVAATNSIGTGSLSSSSLPITPRTVPGLVGRVSGTPSANRAVLSWSTPVSNGGAAVVAYAVQYSSDGAKTWTTSPDQPTTTSTVVRGLSNGVSYVFRVAALNAAGQGAFSVASDPVTPRATTPGEPTKLSASAGPWVANLLWAAPASDGGARITGYQIQFSTDNGRTWVTANKVTQATAFSTSARVAGLVPGRSYVFRVAATNSVGVGGYSTMSSAVTPTR
jgi:hypothetical protein